MLNVCSHVKYETIFFIYLSLFIIIIYLVNGSKKEISNDYKSPCKSQVERKPLISVWNPAIKAAKTAVVFLYNDKVHDLAPTLASLDKHFADNISSDIIIFHTGYPFKRHQESIANVTKRQIIFYNVDEAFMSFPQGFDPYREEPNWTKRGKWNYQHMCRFWFKLMIDIPVVIKYDYLMRLDSDSKLQGDWFNIFHLMEKKTAVYFGNVEEADSEDGLPGLMNLKTFTLYYQKINKVTPRNPIRLKRAFDIPKHIRLYNTNFDVIKVEFFRRHEIRRWVDAIDETSGIFKYRWGDHVLRYITTALFAGPAEVLLRTDFNLPYCHPC